jgi:hypothetical protein
VGLTFYLSGAHNNAVQLRGWTAPPDS